MQVVQWLLWALGLIVLIPTSLFALEILAAFTHRTEMNATAGPRPTVAVLVPAHNEASGIAETLATISTQLLAGDRMVVVADNCTDDTARLAQEGGAEVVERFNTTLRGKGYALDVGMRHIERDPTEVVFIVDADCIVAAGSIDAITSKCGETGRPVQASYLMAAPDGAGVGVRISQFAWLIKNYIRPLGTNRLGWPCLLQGAGMAFPWKIIRAAKLASGHIAEDMKLTVDLAEANAAPIFFPQALVTSVFPMSQEGIASQRIRWEHGHLNLIAGTLPKVLLNSVSQRNFHLFIIALDVAVPPLSLLALFTLVLLICSYAFWWFTGRAWTAFPITITFVMQALSFFTCWIIAGRTVLESGNLLNLPGYALKKIPLYLKFLYQRQLDWIRTKRD